MKILHLISQRPDSTGSGIYLQAVMAQAAMSGHDNFLVAALPPGPVPQLEGIPDKQIFFLHFETEENPNRIVGMSDVMPYPTGTFRELDDRGLARYLSLFTVKLREALDAATPDLIHTNHLWLLTSLACQLFPDIPKVASCHGSELRQFKQCPRFRQYVTRGCRQLDRILALTEVQREEISAMYTIDTQHIEVTGAGYDDTLFYPATSREKERIPQILYAGKLSRAKGVPWLLKALTKIKYATFHLHLVGGGSGDEYTECIDLAGKLQGKITVHGTISQKMLAELMRSCQLFILPSLHEGLPLVVLEALACGCRVLATELPGTREISTRIATDRLYLVSVPRVIDTDSSEIENEEHFVDSIQSKILDMIRICKTVPSVEPVLNHYQWRYVFNRIEKVWESLF